MTLRDLTGVRFGRLLVIQRQGSMPNGSGTTPAWLVKCECGTEKIVSGSNIRKLQSCGCLGHHGMFGTPEHSAWTSMIQRCENPKNKKFPH